MEMLKRAPSSFTPRSPVQTVPRTLLTRHYGDLASTFACVVVSKWTMCITSKQKVKEDDVCDEIGPRLRYSLLEDFDLWTFWLEVLNRDQKDCSRYKNRPRQGNMLSCIAENKKEEKLSLRKGQGGKKGNKADIYRLFCTRHWFSLRRPAGVSLYWTIKG